MDKLPPIHTHNLVLVNTYLTGEEEWVCPICEFRQITSHDPQRLLEILGPGIASGSHEKNPKSQTSTLSSEDLNNLAPWVAWISQVDFDTLQPDENRQN